MKATIDVYGARRDISLLLLPDEVFIGDYVLVHAGFAIQKIQEDIAQESLSLIQQVLSETSVLYEHEDVEKESAGNDL